MASTEGLSTKGILRLILKTVERVENIVSAASEYMTAALADLDTQMASLQGRLTGDAQALKDAIAELNLSKADSAALTAAAERVSATADLVGGLAQPSAVADEAQPDVVVDPIPAEGGAGEATPAEPETMPGVPAGSDPTQATPGDPTGQQG